MSKLFIIATLFIIIWKCNQNIIIKNNNYVFLYKNKVYEQLTLKYKKSKDQKVIKNNYRIYRYILQRKITEKRICEYIISYQEKLNNILIQCYINKIDIKILFQQYPMLENIKLSQSFSWEKSKNSRLKKLIWRMSKKEIRIYEKITIGFKEKITITIGKWKLSTLFTLVNYNCFSAISLFLNKHDVNDLIKKLRLQIRFKRLYEEDIFSIFILQENIKNKKNIKNYLIFIKLYVNNNYYYIFRASNGYFYNQYSNKLISNFIRFPTKKSFPISSKFNPKRINPITGKISSHRGVDFAMPTGTPVLSIGNGKVIIRKKDRVAGNYIVIMHNKKYITRYMHLKKILVKNGQKIKCGEIIGLSGNTGRSTGPHLHFELWINKKAVDPLTSKLLLMSEKLNKNNQIEINWIKDLIHML